MAVKKNRGRFIKSTAKKYEGIRKKQALANKYLKTAKANIGVNHRSYVATMDKIHMFQKMHGQSRKQTLSMEALRTGDVEMYEQLLDSIIDSTYINPNKYEKHKKNQLEFAIEQGWAKNENEAQKIYDFRNSSLFEELEDLGLSDVPSDILDRAKKYNQADLTLQDFQNMTRAFLKEYKNDDVKSSEFFDYSDKYMKAKQERKEDFDKALNVYFEDEIEGKFLDFLKTF